VSKEGLLSGDRVAASIGTWLGALFESLATQSIRVYAGSIGATTGHLRTKDGAHEIDLIVEGPDRHVIAIEIKLVPTVSDTDVRHLNWLAGKLGDQLVDRLVVTTGPVAYRRRDGVAVVPLALLGPRSNRPRQDDDDPTTTMGRASTSTRSPREPLTSPHMRPSTSSRWYRPRAGCSTHRRPPLVSLLKWSPRPTALHARRERPCPNSHAKYSSPISRREQVTSKRDCTRLDRGGADGHRACGRGTPRGMSSPI